MNITLFLGAGFSKAFGLPVMNTFLPFAQGSANLNAEDKQFLYRLSLDARRANSFLESSPRNLEDILSFALMAERLETRSGTTMSTLEQLRFLLQRVFADVGAPPEYWKQLDRFRHFLGFDPKRQGHSLSILTTNYDLNIECALHRMEARASIGFSSDTPPQGQFKVTGRLYSDHGVPLLKLHGSLNWFQRSGDATRVEVEDRLVAVQGPIGKPQISYELPLACTRSYRCETAPLLVPPSYLKPDVHPVLRQVWSAAAAALAAADQVVFVGYSFPQSDTEMRYFLASALVDNAHLQRILIIDPDALAICSRLQAPESGFGSHFRQFLSPAAGQWEGTSLGLTDVQT